jgi:hypothetical protein
VRHSCSRRRSCRAAGLLFLRPGKEASFGGCFFAGSVRVLEGAPESFIRFPYFCESERFYDGIPGGGVGDGRVVGSSAGGIRFVFHSDHSQDGSRWTFIVKVASGCCSRVMSTASAMRCVSCEIGVGVEFGLLPAMSLKL